MLVASFSVTAWPDTPLPRATPRRDIVVVRSGEIMGTRLGSHHLPLVTFDHRTPARSRNLTLRDRVGTFNARPSVQLGSRRLCFKRHHQRTSNKVRTPLGTPFFSSSYHDTLGTCQYFVDISTHARSPDSRATSIFLRCLSNRTTSVEFKYWYFRPEGLEYEANQSNISNNAVGEDAQ